MPGRGPPPLVGWRWGRSEGMRAVTWQQVAQNGNVKMAQMLKLHGEWVPEYRRHSRGPDDGHAHVAVRQRPVCRPDRVSRRPRRQRKAADQAARSLVVVEPPHFLHARLHRRGRVRTLRRAQLRRTCASGLAPPRLGVEPSPKRGGGDEGSELEHAQFAKLCRRLWGGGFLGQHTHASQRF